PEEIPDGDALYMRVHRQYLNKEGKLAPGAFRDRGRGMSTDWSKYSTPPESLKRANQPTDNGIIELGVGGVRSIKPLTVEHDPIPANQAHTQVIGTKDEEIRLKLLRLAAWRIPCPPKS